MKCLHCDNTAKEGARACVECLDKMRLDCIDAITKSMEALMKCHNGDIACGQMTEYIYNSNMKEYHDLRIEKDILLGLLPEPKKVPRRIRW